MTVDEGATDGAPVVAKGTFDAGVPSGDTMHAEVPLVERGLKMCKERALKMRKERRLNMPKERALKMHKDPRFLH